MSFWAVPTEVLGYWHAYRTPILTTIAIAAIIFRFVLHAWYGTDETSDSPKLSPVDVPENESERDKKKREAGWEAEVEEALRANKERQEAASLAAEKAVEEMKRDSAAVEVAVRQQGPRRVQGGQVLRKGQRRSPARNGVVATGADAFDPDRSKIQLHIFFSSLAGNTERVAGQLHKDIASWVEREKEAGEGESSRKNIIRPLLHDLSEVDYDDYFITSPKDEVEGAGAGADIYHFYLVLIPSYDIDTLLNNFLEHLQETHNDFRIDTAPLSGILGYSVFGFGDREGWPNEEQGFCYQAKEVDKWLAKLTNRKRAFPLGMGDVKSDGEQRLKEWREGVQDVLVELAAGKGLGEGVPGSGDAVESGDEEEEDIDSAGDESSEENGVAKKQVKPKNKTANVDDVEDLGRIIKSSADDDANGPLAIDFTTYKPSSKTTKPAFNAPKEMVPKSSPTYAALTKQGYSIVGSHSGVKICRWTKSALRGRGSCYKYSFYGIASHLCMESTPSLSCSNKCVFCWRHGTNPVGTNWRWVVDPPELIYAGVTAAHYQKIKMLKGVPGVRAERFAEAQKIRHCALSLVGEPIFYPHINEFVSLLHRNRISSFLVCNAQHPAQLATLKPVTQLYVSIDASNKESLRKIDRPLHRDFWERFQACMDILRARRHEQRTVFRLTLVKGFNLDEEVQGYADLVERALPGFVEIKGVTYCGTSASSAAGLTMQNVPFYHEVCTFVTALNDELANRNLPYGIAAEHAHSCCVLLADSSRFKLNGQWHTRIDYDAFFDLVAKAEEQEAQAEKEGAESAVPFTWTPEDYIDPNPTPEWALWGNGGFDPRDQRVHKKGKKAKAMSLLNESTTTSTGGGSGGTTTNDVGDSITEELDAGAEAVEVEVGVNGSGQGSVLVEM